MSEVDSLLKGPSFHSEILFCMLITVIRSG